MGPTLRVVVEGCEPEVVVGGSAAVDCGAEEAAEDEAEEEAEAEALEAEADEGGSPESIVEFPAGSGTAPPSLIDEDDPLISL